MKSAYTVPVKVYAFRCYDTDVGGFIVPLFKATERAIAEHLKGQVLPMNGSRPRGAGQRGALVPCGNGLGRPDERTVVRGVDCTDFIGALLPALPSRSRSVSSDP
jgi:hypothetical protein